MLEKIGQKRRLISDKLWFLLSLVFCNIFGGLSIMFMSGGFLLFCSLFRFCYLGRWFNDLFVYSVKGKKQTCFPLKGINKVWSKIKSNDDGNMEKNLSPHWYFYDLYSYSYTTHWKRLSEVSGKQIVNVHSFMVIFFSKF